MGQDAQTFEQLGFEFAPVGLAVLGLDGRWLHFNAKLCELLQCSADLLRKQGADPLLGAEGACALRAASDQLLRGPMTRVKLEQPHVRADGSQLWLTLHLSLHRVDDRPRHLVLAVEDSSARHLAELSLQQSQEELEQRVRERTEELSLAVEVLRDSVRERQRSEAAVLQSESECRAILDGALDAFISIDECSRVVDWNGQAEKTFGWSRDEALGQALESLIVPPAQRGAHRQRVLSHPGDGPSSILGQRRELEGCRRDGSIVPVEMTVTRLPLASSGRRYVAFLHDISDRLEARRQLQQASERYQDLYDNAPCGYCAFDAQGVFLRVNKVALQWLGCSEQALIGRMNLQDFLLTSEGPQAEPARDPEPLAGPGPVELSLHGRDGLIRRVSMTATVLRDEQGDFVMTRAVLYDITELAQIRMALEEANRRQELMLDNDLIGMVRLRERKPVWQNKAFERMFGYGCAELGALSLRALYFDDASYQAFGEISYPVLKSGSTYRSELMLRRKDGAPIWVDVSGVLLDAAGKESMWLSLDITAQKVQQQAVERLAFVDALTQLPNRLLFKDRARQAISQTLRSQRVTAICFIDLDSFKQVNDRLGHEAGDQLLREVARRLAQSVRPHDTVARLGGDEFLLLLTDLAHPEECEPILKRVLASVARPVPIDGAPAQQVSASIGVAFCPEHGADVDALIAAADQAMYEAKRAGKQRVVQA